MVPRAGRIGASIVWLAALAGSASSQEQTAAIAGVVKDPGGGLVPGASLTAASGGGFSVRAVSDALGRYRFPSLPPGEYALTAALAGFAPARVERIELRLGQELSIPIAFEAGAASDSIRVTDESPLLAVTQSARATSLRAEEIEKLPNGREFTDVVDQLAGAVIEPKTGSWRQIEIDGSSVAENRFVVDGAETTDLIHGTSRQLEGRSLPTDFLEEVQVKSSGYTAEYGGSTGGVVNAITRSGSNAWHGDAVLYWEQDELDAEPRPTLQLDPVDPSVAEYVSYPEDDYHGLEPGFTLGGPIVRDRLWFFAGYMPAFEPVSRTAPFADGVTRTLREYRKSHQAVASLSGQLGARWRFRVATSLGRTRREGTLQRQDGTSPPGADYDDVLEQPSWSASATVDWLPGPSVLTSLRASYWARDWYTENVYEGDQLRWVTSSIGVPGVPPEYQQPRGYANVPSNFGWDREQQGRLALQWDGTVFFSRAGRHQLRVGLQLERRTLDILGGNTGNVHDLFWGQSFAGQRGEFGYYRVLSNPVLPNRGSVTAGDAGTTSLGLFVQDAWSFGDRLTLHLGLRSEDEDVPSFSREPGIPETAIHFGFGDKLAPRLGLAWDATGDGRTKLFGSWGVFYDVMKLYMPLVYGGDFLEVFWYTLDDADLAGIENNPRCPPQCPGRSILSLDLSGQPINDPEAPLLDPALEPMRLQEVVIGVERQLGDDVSLGVRYVHKQLDRAVEDVGLRDAVGGHQTRIANPGFGMAESFVPEGGTEAIPYPRARRDYDAVEIGLRKRMSDGWAGRFSYVWSRLSGNAPGLADGDFFSVAPNVNRTFDSYLMAFDERAQPVYGALATDRPHQLKAQLVRELSTGTSVGASWFGASGLARTRGAQFVPGEGYAVFYRGRASDGRMPFTSRLDLQLQQRIGLGARARLTLGATVFNLLNQGTATDYYAPELFTGQAIDIAESDFFAGFDTGQLIDEQGLVRDPRFLMDRFFQQPRVIRLSARLSF